MRSNIVLRCFVIAPALAIGCFAVGCTNETSTPTGASSSSSSSGDVSSSSSSSSSGMGGMGGIGGSGGAAGMGGMGGAAGMGGSGGSGGGVPIICEPNTTSACYTGPAGTLGVGICVGGTWTCNADGTAYGPCNGEVLPAAENCATPADENCNGTGPDCGVATWSKRFGDLDGQYGRAVAADAMGNVYVAGTFFSSIDFGAGPMTATFLDGFLVKLDPSGNLLWSKQFAGAGSQKPLALAIDSANNVVVVGNFENSVDFGGGPLVANASDAFAAKYDSAGNHIWSKRFGDLDFQNIATVDIDTNDNLLFGGEFAGSVDFGGGTLVATGIDFFVVKLDKNGNHIWSKILDQQNGSQPQMMDVATDSAGNSVFTGLFFGTLDLGGSILTSAGYYDTFIAKFGPAGQHLWSKRFGGTNGEDPNGLGIDDAGNIYMAGNFDSTIDFGGGPLTTVGNQDMYVVKFDSGGNHLWSKRYGSTLDDGLLDMAVTKTGDLALAVTFANTVDFGGGPLASAGGLDMAFARLDNTGKHIWSHRAGDANVNQAPYAIAFDPMGYVLITGELVGGADFGNGVLTSAGSSDLFIAKLAP